MYLYVDSVTIIFKIVDSVNIFIGFDIGVSYVRNDNRSSAGPSPVVMGSA